MNKIKEITILKGLVIIKVETPEAVIDVHIQLGNVDPDNGLRKIDVLWIIEKLYNLFIDEVKESKIIDIDYKLFYKINDNYFEFWFPNGNLISGTDVVKEKEMVKLKELLERVLNEKEDKKFSMKFE